jgi:hypothetical protein
MIVFAFCCVRPTLAHCAKFGVGRYFGRPIVVVAGWYREHGDELVAVDLDFGDVGSDDRFALAAGAVLEHVREVGADLFDGLGAGRLGGLLGELVEVVAAGYELVELGGEVAEALAAGAFVEGAVFEGVDPDLSRS